MVPNIRVQELSKKYRLTHPGNFQDLKMSTKRIRHTAKFKTQIAVEAINSTRLSTSCASFDHQLHPSQISQWKKQLLDHGSDRFSLPI